MLLVITFCLFYQSNDKVWGGKLLIVESNADDYIKEATSESSKMANANLSIFILFANTTWPVK